MWRVGLLLCAWASLAAAQVLTPNSSGLYTNNAATILATKTTTPNSCTGFVWDTGRNHLSTFFEYKIVTVGACTGNCAQVQMQHSLDGGSTWAVLANSDTGALIASPGTFTLDVPVSPVGGIYQPVFIACNAATSCQVTVWAFQGPEY